MSPDEMRIAIAEACGWSLDYRGLGWLSPSGEFAELPDYLQDLNAMHEAEMTLSEPNRRTYGVEVWETVRANGIKKEGEAWFVHITATADQRAEAFLRTIGKWEGGAA